MGCDYCPLNKVPGIRKIKGLIRIAQRKAMLWAQSPGKKENKFGKELIGPAGELLWNACKYHGLKRSMFDIQNVLRCRPMYEGEYSEHKPTKDELRCCSVYNERALELNQGAAHVHVVMGEVAGKQLLKSRYKKKTPIFWHHDWNAYVVLVPHTAFLLRQGGEKGWAYYDFRDRLKCVAAILQHPGRWGYVKSQDYGVVQSERDLDWAIRRVKAEAAAGRRIGVDVEDGKVDGKKKTLLVGLSWGKYLNQKWDSWKGGARTIALYHPEADQSPERIRKMRLGLKSVLEDPSIKKSLQHGSYDSDSMRDLLGIRMRGYEYDSQYGAYIKNSALKTYSFDSQVRMFFQEFADYKTMVSDHFAGQGVDTEKAVYNSGAYNFADVPLKRLGIYNCADADLTIRNDRRFSGSINEALVKVYIDVAFILDEMENTGPILDRELHAELSKAIPALMEPIENKLRRISGDPDFNPGAAPQVAKLLYDKLKLELELDLPEEEDEYRKTPKRSTKADVLSMLYQQTGHPAILLTLQWRTLATAKNTFLRGYAASADRNNDELRTIWWLTGAATGRLRSGKGGQAEAEGIINFQNLHGNPYLQNLLVSDKNWRVALEAV